MGKSSEGDYCYDWVSWELGVGSSESGVRSSEFGVGSSESGVVSCTWGVEDYMIF
jgi:hypothetical protein